MSDPRLVSKLARGIRLLSVGNPKTMKGTTKGYVTGILHLAPAMESGRNTCAAHTTECAAACLYFAGRGAMQKIQEARIRRTNQFFDDRPTFLATLRADINQLFWNAFHLGFETVIRLNGTSDIRWELYDVIQHFPDIIAYDYTKLPNRTNLPPNYHLTFSFSGTNLAACKTALANGMSVAVPFINRPDTWLGYPVIDGDADDLRFIGNGPAIVGLRAKGRLRTDPTSIFLGDNHA